MTARHIEPPCHFVDIQKDVTHSAPPRTQKKTSFERTAGGTVPPPDAGPTAQAPALFEMFERRRDMRRARTISTYGENLGAAAESRKITVQNSLP